MSGSELKETVRNFVEGYEGGFIPFNRGSLPIVSGISVKVRKMTMAIRWIKLQRMEK